jgi:4-hydroxy-tetrahydrodipicolinate synthase
MRALADRLRNGLIPAVPVPFRGGELAEEAQRAYASWMAAHPIAGVAVWAHTGRGRQLSGEQRHTVMQAWREALPDRVIVAGAHDITTAIDARRGRADAILAFPTASDPVAYHLRLSRELPVIAFYLYEAAGGVSYDDATLRAILTLPNVIGIKLATLDSVPTFERVAALVRTLPGKLLITGEDRFLGDTIRFGADAALVGMGAALPDLQAALLRAASESDWERFATLSSLCDRFADATFGEPVEGYIQRMLWAAAADGALPDDACDDPWAPPLPEGERAQVVEAVRNARAARA